MISEGDTSCFTNGLPQDLNNMYGDISEDLAVPVAVAGAGATDTHCTSLLYNLSVLKDKVHHLQSLVTVLIAPDPPPPPQQNQHESTASSMVMASISTLVQEVIVTASSMMFTCQLMGMAIVTQQPIQERGGQQGSYSCDQQNLDWYGDNIYNPHTISIYSNNTEVEWRDQEHAQSQSQSQKNEGNGGGGLGKGILVNKCEDIIELDASDILAKYTHYCHVCGKGFKRDANLRMHMRAHGDEYKSPAALTNPMKKISSHGNSKEDDLLLSKPPRKYSCPQEGCRWNRKHAKFQPLKSMICVKNHYKRSHCPKMYVCKRCNQKQFSVLSDLRTHEKHCGDLKWLCSCGTTFSRKDKLMGHVALFFGHTPAISSSTATAMIKQG